MDLKVMDEQEFQTASGAALDSLFRRLSAAADRYDFEPDFNSGALSVEFEEPKAKFVVSPNAPVRQVWVSAQSKSFKLDWDAGRGAFVLPATGESLEQLLATLIGQQMNEKVSL
jgi:CyaY protein